MKLEWDICNEIEWMHATVWSEFGQYEVYAKYDYDDEGDDILEPTGFYWKLNLQENGSYDAGDDCDSLELGMADCQSDYDARVAAIALANGYVKLEPGQVVVDAKSLFPFIDDRCRECSNRNICRSGEFACKLQSIYDAIKGGYHE